MGIWCSDWANSWIWRSLPVFWPAWCYYPATMDFSPMAKIFMSISIRNLTNSDLSHGTWTMPGALFISWGGLKNGNAPAFGIHGLGATASLSVSLLSNHFAG